MFPSDTELDTRVGRGAALLDSANPGWEVTIDLDALDISDSMFCAAAQVIGNSASEDAYLLAMDTLGLDYTGRIHHGFSLTIEELGTRSQLLRNNAQEVLYAPLTEAWKRLILTRLADLESTR